MSHSSLSNPKKYSDLEILKGKSIPLEQILSLKVGKECSYLWHWDAPTMDHLIGVYIKEYQYDFAVVSANFDEEGKYSQVLNPNNNSSKLWYFI